MLNPVYVTVKISLREKIKANVFHIRPITHCVFSLSFSALI